jgi:DNA-binding response OmpR family regulator
MATMRTLPSAPGSAELSRPIWIALAEPGSPVSVAAGSIDDDRLMVTTDPDRFGRILTEGRPRLAILADPPASPAVLDLAVGERRRRPSLRLVHVSPVDAIGTRLAALERGFDEAVASTIDPTELVARIRLLDARSRRRPDSLLEVADGVVLDLVAHEVRRDGSLVHLRPKEFQLLSMLATHPGRAYTRRQLLDRVWGHDHDGDPRTVDVHVRWLRAKLERQPETPAHLITVRGVGYRLDPVPR